MKRFAVTALVMKKIPTGHNYQLGLDVITASDSDDARGKYSVHMKDVYPDHALYEVLAVEVATS